MLGRPRVLSRVTFPRVLIVAIAAAALALAVIAPPARAEWPTSCVALNDIVEGALGNHMNVGIYQRVFGEQAEQACQNDHRADVRSVFAWAIAPSTPTPAPAPAPTQAPAPPAPTSPAIGEIRQLVASPFVAQDGTIWLGTATGGVLRSTNSGASFTQMIGGLPNLAINAILPSPTIHTDSIVLAATNNGVARSTNRGETWTTVTGLPGGRISALAASPFFQQDRIFFAAPDAGGFYQSADGGANWSAVPAHHANSLPAGTYLGMDAVEARGGTTKIFAWTTTQIHTSDNRGAGFNPLLSEKALPGDLRISAVAVHPEWARVPVIWVGSELHGLYRSINGGDDFHKVIENPDELLGRINVIAVSPLVSRDGAVAVGTTKRGVYFSKRGNRFQTVSDPGGRKDWNHRSVNLTINNVHGLAFSNAFQEDRMIFAGGQTQVAFSHSAAIDWYTYPDPVGPIG